MSINNNQSTEQKYFKANWYIRIIIAVFCLLLVAMIGYRFAWVDPKGEISTGIITLLCLLLILVLSESFDNFTIGKLFSVSREVKKKEKEVDKLEKQNSQLLSQLISISNSQSQNQNHTNVYGDYHVAPTVRKASEEEVRDKQTSETPTVAAVTAAAAEPSRSRLNWRKAEEIGLKKYVAMRSIHPSNLIIDAKLVNQFQGIDPISNQQIIFDGYIKEHDHETFLEIRPAGGMNILFRDRLYVMLSKINHYRIAKRVDAHLDLVIMKIPSEDVRNPAYADRFLESFEPAIAGGLLKLMSVEFTEEEAAACRGTQ